GKPGRPRDVQRRDHIFAVRSGLGLLAPGPSSHSHRPNDRPPLPVICRSFPPFVLCRFLRGTGSTAIVPTATWTRSWPNTSISRLNVRRAVLPPRPARSVLPKLGGC